MGDDRMSDRAQRVLDALMKYDEEYGTGFPTLSISRFFIQHKFDNNLQEDYEALTDEEEKQVIQAFLEFAY